jgi:tRNA/rRNA methyltransferase
VAVLFGSEKTGLSNRDLSHLPLAAAHSDAREHRSMNLAQAVAIVVYELSRGASTPRPETNSRRLRLGRKLLPRINQALREALDLSGYIHPRAAASAEEKLRRMLLRFELRAADAEVLLGMLRKILWKLKAGKSE